MQQAIYNINPSSANSTTGTATGPAIDGMGIIRWVGRKWDLVGIVTLMASSTAYGLFALANLA